MNKTMEETINVAKQFSKYPGGRFLDDGDESGQRFRDEMLAPALKRASRVVVQLDGTLGYGSSFLEEAFGGLVREAGFNSETLKKSLVLKTDNEVLSYNIFRYIDEADARAKILV